MLLQVVPIQTKTENVALGDTYVLWSLGAKNQEALYRDNVKQEDIIRGMPVLGVNLAFSFMCDAV